jgi:hypothetical protein
MAASTMAGSAWAAAPAAAQTRTAALLNKVLENMI